MITEDDVIPMNAEVKAKWLTALRDGSYRQAVGKLNDKNGFCCLGVLCDLVDNTKWEEIHGYVEYRGKIYMPPHDVMESVGLDESVVDKVARMNDEGSSFAEIADFLERHV